MFCKAALLMRAYYSYLDEWWGKEKLFNYRDSVKQSTTYHGMPKSGAYAQWYILH